MSDHQHEFTLEMLAAKWEQVGGAETDRDVTGRYSYFAIVMNSV